MRLLAGSGWRDATGLSSLILRSIFPPFLLAAESQTSPSYLLSQTQTACSFSAGKYYFSRFDYSPCSVLLNKD